MSSEKKERSFVIDAIILCVITLVLGGILAGVYTMTKGTIAQRQADTDSKACEKVIASVDGATVADAGDDAVAQANDFLTKHILNSSKEVEEEQSESYSKYVNVTTVKKLQVNGSDAGYVYIADAKKGYGGSISFVLGVYNGTVTGIEITSQSETAGLGANCESDSFKDKFALDKGLQYPSSDEIPMFYKAGTTPKDERDRLGQCPERPLLPVRLPMQLKVSFTMIKS